MTQFGGYNEVRLSPSEARVQSTYREDRRVMLRLQMAA